MPYCCFVVVVVVDDDDDDDDVDSDYIVKIVHSFRKNLQ